MGKEQNGRMKTFRKNKNQAKNSCPTVALDGTTVSIEELKVHFSHLKTMRTLAQRYENLRGALQYQKSNVFPRSPAIRDPEEAKYARGTAVPMDSGLEYTSAIMDLEKKVKDTNVEYHAALVLFISFYREHSFDGVDKMTNRIICALAMDGRSVAQVAKACECSSSRIYKLLERAGVEMRAATEEAGLE